MPCARRVCGGQQGPGFCVVKRLPPALSGHSLVGLTVAGPKCGTRGELNMAISKPNCPNACAPTMAQFLESEPSGGSAAFINAGQAPAACFFGPPGCGKSTLACCWLNPRVKISAAQLRPGRFAALRRALARVEILVLDELHRFPKRSRISFCPWWNQAS